ncbi:hypothetical protein OROMI_034639 [Orobanche minor]
MMIMADTDDKFVRQRLQCITTLYAEIQTLTLLVYVQDFYYVMIVFKGFVPMAFGGTEQPAAYGELVSIGGLNSDVDKKLSGAIANILETKLSIPKSRFYLKFYDTKAYVYSTTHAAAQTLLNIAVYPKQNPCSVIKLLKATERSA